MTDQNATDGWLWFSGSNDENYSNTHNTREHAIAELDGHGGYIVEARQDPMRMANYIDADSLFESAEEDASEFSNGDGDPIFECTRDQQSDLQDRLRQACDKWQEDHELVFKPWCFTDTRNSEKIAPDEPRADAVTHVREVAE